jgi:hypothetical protein
MPKISATVRGTFRLRARFRAYDTIRARALPPPLRIYLAMGLAKRVDEQGVLLERLIEFMGFGEHNEFVVE